MCGSRQHYEMAIQRSRQYPALREHQQQPGACVDVHTEQVRRMIERECQTGLVRVLPDDAGRSLAHRGTEVVAPASAAPLCAPFGLLSSVWKRSEEKYSRIDIVRHPKVSSSNSRKF